MKRRFILSMTLFALSASSALTACNPDDGTANPGTATPAPNPRPDPAPDPDPNPDPNPDPDPSTGSRMRISIGSAAFTVKFEDNAAARAFKALLPMTATMNDLNRNEKYCDLPQNLPTAAYAPGAIRAGDIMLYGARTLVLFYKSFPTSYSYTRIGSVDDPDGLESALGAGNVRIAFEPLR